MNGATGRAVVALAAAADSRPEQWVHLMPAGRFDGRDGRGPYRLSDPGAVIEATRRYAGAVQLPVDFEHQTDRAPQNGRPAPAAGWIKGLQARADGIWGLVEWTAPAAAQIAARAYRYLSPVFRYARPSGEVKVLLRAGLTNTPNLDLTALASAGGTMDDDFEDLARSLRTVLGLPEDAAPDIVLAKVRGLVEAAQAADPDPARYVPIGALRQAVTELQETRHGFAREAAELAVSQAIAQGKLPPSLRDWGLALCRSNRAAFDQFIGGMPAAFAPLGTALLPKRAPAGEGRNGLTESQLAICSALGVSPEDYAKNIKE
jgi:phage I-like protein